MCISVLCYRLAQSKTGYMKYLQNNIALFVKRLWRKKKDYQSPFSAISGQKKTYCH